jgi:hypothetical protein
LDIRALTMDEAISIYHRDYWLPISGDDLPPALAIATFDCAVNQGVTKAKRILQLALKRHGRRRDRPEDDRGRGARRPLRDAPDPGASASPSTRASWPRTKASSSTP